MIRKLLAWGPAVVWAAVLFYLSSQTWSGGPALVEINDKVGHFLLYATLGAALGYGRVRSPGPVPHWLLLTVGFLYAVSDEIHQSFVPGRTASLTDLAADAVGLLAGYGGYLALTRTGSKPGAEATDINP
ncbi:MAG TPA: VanZ family protein [Longimicrobiales bacterium]|nr:VanZ family protein [Longimicrobiales bacterium]